MLQIHQNNVHTKVPKRMCVEETGRKPVNGRWLDINKGNPEYRSRLVAQGINIDKRQDLVAATPPLEANKILFCFALT